MARRTEKNKGVNQKLSWIFFHMAELYRINSVLYKPAAYEKAALSLKNLDEDVSEIYRAHGIKGVRAISGIGKSMGEKIEEYLKKRKISFYEDLKKKTALREIITHFFETKGVSLKRLKADSKKRNIVYAHYAKRANELLELAESVEKAKDAITTVAAWASSRGLDYTIETVAKRWLELDRLKPKEIVKKPFYRGNPMVWSEAKKKWFVVRQEDGEWLEFADKESTITWEEEKK